jgi:hypothetical protein
LGDGATSAYLLFLPWWLPELILALDSARLLVRACTAILILAPAGFLLCFGFPTGMRLVAAIDPRPMPWFWGINGAGGVLAASVAVLVSVGLSIDRSLQLGAICYVLLLWPGLSLLRAGAASLTVAARSA